MSSYLNVLINEYLNKDETKVSRLEEFNEKINTPMHEKCMVSVVVPAYNEAGNIKSLIENVRKQASNLKDGIIPEYFEVIIVNNNSTDNTEEIAQEYIRNNLSVMRIIVVSINFSENERGVGSARKLGIDLSLYRAYKRANPNINHFYIANLDTDNLIPSDHFFKIVRTIQETGADILMGRDTFNSDIFPNESHLREIGEAIKKYRLDIHKNKPPLFKLTSQNSVIAADVYIKAGGYPKWKMADDIRLGIEAAKYTDKVVWLDSAVELSQRNIIENPFEIITREVWDRNRWEAESISRREKKHVKGSYDYSDDYIKKCLTTFLDDTCWEIAQNENISYERIMGSEREHFARIAIECGVKKSLLPDNNLFNIGKYSIETVRSFMQYKDRERVFQHEVEVLKEIIGAMSAVSIGQLAAYLLGACSEVPSIMTIAITSGTIEKLLERLPKTDFRLFEITHQNKLRYYKTVIGSGAILSTKNPAEFVIMKVTEEGVPYYTKECFKVIVFKENDLCVYIDNIGLFCLPNEIDQNIKYISGLPIGNIALCMLMSESISNGSNKYIKALYDVSQDTEKNQFKELLEKRLSIYKEYLCTQIENFRAEGMDQIGNKLSNMVFDILGLYYTKRQRDKYLKIVKSLKDIVISSDDNIMREVEEILIKDIFPVQVEGVL